MQIKNKSNVIKHFLVLSDLHIISRKIDKEKNDHHQDFQKAFLKFLKTRSHGLDYVLVAGDLTDKNNKDGYNDLSIFLEEIAKSHMNNDKNKISAKERMIFCPGNHDQDRGQLDAVMRLIVKSKPNGSPGGLDYLKAEALLNYLNTKEDSYEQLEKIHRKKFKNYLEFIRNFYPKELVEERTKVGFTLNFGDVLISSLNSSWFCDYPDRRLNDDGHLILGKKYVERSFEFTKAKDNNNSSIPRITIMHHPPENLVWQETYSPDKNKNTTQYITDHSSLVISGHVHGVPRTLGYDSSAFLLSNGTSYNTSLEMSFVMFDLNLFNGDVSLKKYRIKGKKLKNGTKFNIEQDKQSHGFQRFKIPLIRQKTHEILDY